MRRLLSVLGLFVCAVGSGYGQRPAPDTGGQLPVRRVILYKSGVGYFEHLGSVTGNADVAIQFTTAQLNDVLQSLTTIDLDGGAIANISYNSIAPIEQRLSALRLPLAADADRLQFYSALRGARVEVHSGAAIVSGRLLAVEQRPKTSASGNTSEAMTEITVASEDGAVRTVELTASTTVHFLDRDVREDVASYLGIVSSSRGEDVRRMVLSTSGTGARRLFVSYISEVPIWKSTYRLVLPADTRKPTLQGWAVVDNTIGQDWTNVELSLVAGAPQSFVQEISQPYYAHRPVVPLPSTVQLQPQTHGATLATLPPPPPPMAEKIRAEAGAPSNAPRAAGRGFAGGAAGGVIGGVVGGLPEAPPSPVDYLANAAPAAQGQDLGDLFEYKLTQPVTIRKNESALVPIVNAAVDAERVSIWSRGAGSGRPLRGVWLTNTSVLTLDAGSFTVIDANAFAGEGLVESMKPGEKRLMSYGADLAVLVKGTLADGSGHVTKIVAREGILTVSQEDRATWKYTARNEDTTARTLVIEHPLRPGWTVGADPAPAESSATAARYRVPLASKQEATLSVTERHAGTVTSQLVDFDDRTIMVLVRGGVNEAALRRALQPITDKRAEVAAAAAKLETINSEIAEIGRDQERVRENMKALRGSAEEKSLTERYTRELNAQEDRLAALRDEQKKAIAERDTRRRELGELAAKLSLEI